MCLITCFKFLKLRNSHKLIKKKSIFLQINLRKINQIQLERKLCKQNSIKKSNHHCLKL